MKLLVGYSKDGDFGGKEYHLRDRFFSEKNGGCK